jgi:putative SbcD/Mre11-related phosphoesterase
MELLPGLVADGCALFVKGAKTLILADLHIGYEEEARRHGVLVPQEQRGYFAKELERLIAEHRPRMVVLAGDVKHEFGRISQEEWSDVLRLIRRVRELGCVVEVVGGNHDVLIKPILDKLEITLRKVFIITTTRAKSEQSILIVHGDEELDTLVKTGILDKKGLRRVETIIIGHEHPALTITDGVRTETVKCFLAGTYSYARKRYDMVVMPSFNPLAFGTDVLREQPLGPLLADFGGFSAFAVLDDRVLAFGGVERLQRLQRA